MQRLAQGTADRLAAQGIIREEDVPIYRYGLEAMYSSLLELLSILALAALIGNFWQTVLFFAAFIPLRLYAGGYHASTRLRCFLTSLVVYAAFTIMLEIVPVAWFVPLAFRSKQRRADKICSALFLKSTIIMIGGMQHEKENESNHCWRCSVVYVCVSSSGGVNEYGACGQR